MGLLERGSELTELEALLDDACAGSGRLVFIEGPPGIGKTRLLEATRDAARQRGMVALSARPSELDREFPFGVVQQLFQQLIATADRARRARLLAGAAGQAAPLLGQGSPPRADSAALDDASLAHLHALYWLTVNLVEEAPAALVIDDVHWADRSSLRFLQFLLPRLDELPVLLALASRPAEPGSEKAALDALATDPLAHVLRPAPLGRSAVAALISSELGAEADPAFSEACHQATGGNPFLVRELLRELATEGVVPSAAEVGLVREVAPPTVARTVLLRLARLGDDASRLARAVAVLGDGTTLGLACALACLDEERGRELAVALSKASILEAAGGLAFEHPILRSAVYGDMDPAERGRAHRRAAALLTEQGAEAEAIAVHLVPTEPGADSDVVATLHEASERALARGAAPTAALWLRRALAESPRGSDRGRLLFELAAAELRAGETAASAQHFEEAARITPDPRLRAHFAWGHAVALQAVGRHDEAFLVREGAVEAVADADPQYARLIEASLVASACYDLSRLDWGRRRLDHLRGQLAGESPAELGLLAMQAHLDAFSRDSEQSADALADIAQRTLGSERPLVDVPGLATPFYTAIEVMVIADRLEPARRALDRVLDYSRRRGSALLFAFTSGVRSILLARTGELADAEADARTCAELSLSQGWFVMGPVTLGFSLEVLLDRGKLDDAESLLEASGMAERSADHDLTFDPVVHARARMRAARGDLAGARDDLASLRRRDARWNTYPTLSPAVLIAPELIVEDRDEARAGAEQMLKEAYAWGTARAIGMALRAVGLVEGGARGLELHEEATRVLEPSPGRVEYACALSDFGAALRRANRRAAARAPLRRALDIADACGAAPLADRTRAELRAAGARPRRPRISGAQALTASERRVATMAAEGLSNAEIAQALFITKKTVETHLGNAYRKLGIKSRAQLAAALRDE